MPGFVPGHPWHLEAYSRLSQNGLADSCASTVILLLLGYALYYVEDENGNMKKV